jgi:hypothetical protein
VIEDLKSGIEYPDGYGVAQMNLKEQAIPREQERVLVKNEEQVGI